MIQSIPTSYRGCQFRSRLEARWAAFFDLAHLEWDYEPCNLKGWMPDFVLLMPEPVYVEVKPVYFFDKGEGVRIVEVLPELEKVRKCVGYTRLILGNGPQQDDDDNTVIGAVFTEHGLATWEMGRAATIKNFWLTAGSIVQWKSQKELKIPSDVIAYAKPYVIPLVHNIWTGETADFTTNVFKASFEYPMYVE